MPQWDLQWYFFLPRRPCPQNLTAELFNIELKFMWKYVDTWPVMLGEEAWGAVGVSIHLKDVPWGWAQGSTPTFFPLQPWKPFFYGVLLVHRGIIM